MSDRNLLLGFLIIEMRLVSSELVYENWRRSVQEPHRSLCEILIEEGLLAEERRIPLDALVDKHLRDLAKHEQHGRTVADRHDATHDDPHPTHDPHQTLDHVPTNAAEQTGAYSPQMSNAHALAPTVRESRYRILRPHARGGLGEVFVAEDTELRRKVALKEIQVQQADSLNNRGRFVLEAEVTGGLEHPGIVPVYGLGAYPDGRPYYAMRFIHGASLKEAIEQFHASGAGFASLAFRQLLRRFQDVCNAIAYAHSRGVLHRDIKPGNIMLGNFGETLVVDWGLAKRLDRADEATTVVPTEESPANHPETAFETQQGMVIGTPAFMSPEQAQGNINALTAASDVYSLGATLYVILTGQTAFSGNIVELLPRVVQGNFLSPKQRLVSTPAALNAIVVKAMARQPGNRYTTASALAEELERYLADEPVLAYREPWLDRVRRWTRKHRTWVTTGTVAGGVLLTAALAGTLLLGEKNRQLANANTMLDSANANLTNTNSALVAARQDADDKRAVAEASFRLALQSFNDLVEGIQDKLENHPNTEELRVTLLAKAQTGLTMLLQEASKSGNHRTLIWAHLRMGDVYDVLGQATKATAEYRHAHMLAGQLYDLAPGDPRTLRDLGTTHERLGIDFEKQAQWDRALKHYQEMLLRKQHLVERDAHDPVYQRELGIAHIHLSDVKNRLGQSQEAHEHVQKALGCAQRVVELAPTMKSDAERDLSIAYSRLGSSLQTLGHSNEAATAYRKSLAILEPIVPTDPNNILLQRELAYCQSGLGQLCLQTNQVSEALERLQQATQINQRIVDEDKTNTEAKRRLCANFDLLAKAFQRQGKLKDAHDCCLKRYQICQRLAVTDPTSRIFERELADSLHRLGQTTLNMEQPHEALKHTQQSLTINRRLVEAEPTQSTHHWALSQCLRTIAEIKIELKQFKEAFEHYREGLKSIQALTEREPNNLQWQRAYDISLEGLGDAHMQVEQWSEALSYYEKVVSLRQRRCKADPHNREAQRDLAIVWASLGDAELHLDHPLQALTAFTKHWQIVEPFAKAEPKNIQAQRDWMTSHDNIGRVYLHQAEFHVALDWFTKGEQVAKTYSTPTTFPEDLQQLQEMIAFARDADQATSRLEFVFEQKEPAKVRDLARLRLSAMLQHKSDTKAIETAERFATWAEQRTDDRSQYRYVAAGFYALCAKDPKDQDVLAAKSIALLKKLQVDHYFNTSRLMHLKQAPEFATLRHREDFRTLLVDLDKGDKKGP